MIIKSLELKNFRNYRKLELKPSPGINLILGENAQGKSNLLEALYLLSTSRSFRALKEEELIKWGSSYAVISEEVSRKDRAVNLEIRWIKDPENNLKKEIKINNAPIRKIQELLGEVICVIFTPQNLEIVQGAPSVRRRFLDLFLSQLKPSYYRNLLDYNKILTEKNNYLRNFKNRRETALEDVFNEKLSSLGSAIIKERITITEKLDALASSFYNYLSGIEEKISINYLCSIPRHGNLSLEDSYLQHLEKIRELERERGAALTGPHRDDLEILLSERGARVYGSRGQHRTIALSLKLSQKEIFLKETGDEPVVMLDDAFSELDEVHQRNLLKQIRQNGQSFITATHWNNSIIPLEEVERFKIREGKLDLCSLP